MSHINVNQAWWNSSYSTKHQIPQSVSQSLSLKMELPAQLNHISNQIGLQVQEHESSSTQSGSQSHSHSHHEIVATGGTNSSESGQDDSHENNAEGLLKPVMFLPASNHAFNHPQVDYIHQMTHYPYPYIGPHFAGLMAAAYRPQTMMQPQTLGIAPARVQLPLDLAEDGPIYVNAKQYNGIMRRRQMRAKLEAQNKLVKSRKPYLHESRHIHALKRVRGSGGRFLSTKMLEQAESTTTADSNIITYCGDNKSFSSNGVIFGQPDGSFLGIPSHIGRTTMPGVEMRSGTQQHYHAPVVR